MKTLAQFIRENKIHMTADYTDSNPNMMADENWSRNARHFRCVLKRKGKRFTVPFSQGPAINGEPTAADVLNCLASDAGTYAHCGTFEDWCGELGYDDDSRKAEKTYLIVEKQAERLERFLGPEAYAELLYNVEGL